ncbi:MAG: replication initiator protein [Microviridae sp.]|nr:MAG: replication initiator protein [Microviridae sp.]
MCAKPIWLAERQLHVPCGICLLCRNRYARDWAIRCWHEAQLHECDCPGLQCVDPLRHRGNCFGTLTYDDDSLPKHGSLDKVAAQLFMKRLRKGIDPIKVKFYLSGEYGEKNKRPHYHFMLFGYRLERGVEVPSDSGFPVYESPELSEYWKHGIVTVGDVSFASACYVTQYIVNKKDKIARTYKKWNCDPDTGELNEIEVEFSHMSRGGSRKGSSGIGAGWYDKFRPEVERNDNVVVDGNEVMPPRYYDYLLVKRDLAAARVVKLRRERKSKMYNKVGREWSQEYYEDRRDRMAREVIARRELEELERRL